MFGMLWNLEPSRYHFISGYTAKVAGTEAGKMTDYIKMTIQSWTRAKIYNLFIRLLNSSYQSLQWLMEMIGHEWDVIRCVTYIYMYVKCIGIMSLMQCIYIWFSVAGRPPPPTHGIPPPVVWGGGGGGSSSSINNSSRSSSNSTSTILVHTSTT